jgi:hypothetical protein
MATVLGFSEFPSSFHWNEKSKETLICRFRQFIACLASNLRNGGARLRRAVTAGRLLYAKETKALAGCANLLLCDGEGKLVLAWLPGRSPYLWRLAVWFCRTLCLGVLVSRRLGYFRSRMEYPHVSDIPTL